MTAAVAPLIEARGVHVEAGAQTVLHDIALSVDAGERIAVVGRNGAGKSTLLAALAGFGMVTRGSLRVLDTELRNQRDAVLLRKLRGRVAQVHQGLHLVGRLAAIDNVLIGGAARTRSPLTWLHVWPEAQRRAAHAALCQVGLGWAAGRRTDSLSGGERQKVAIARALHQGGSLLLADEPTASLDADAADDVVRTLTEVAARRRVTLVCVVHDLDLLPRLAERAIVLRRGVVVADVSVTAATPSLLRGLLQ
jgi:phosphonate transport system ATP-binding protein